MADVKSASTRMVLMDMLKTKFGGFAFWSKIEVQLAMLCADLPEVTSEEKKEELVRGIRGIKAFLLEKDICLDELGFLDEEIERYEQSKQISLYIEEEDRVDPEVIERYARLGMGSEGVIGIHLPYNYTQLKKLTNGVYAKTGLIKFYISREKTVYGKIVAEVYEYPQKIPIATLIESRKKDPETDEPLEKRVALFGERIDGKEYLRIKEIGVPFYVYRYITEGNQELILMTTEPCEIGDYIITGVITQCDDYRMLTDSAKLRTKLPFLFAQSIRNRIIRFKDHAEFKERLTYLGITMRAYFDYPFTIHKGGVSYVLLQPLWFKWLIWAWLTHSDKGMFNTYPLHILIFGPPSSGKSMLLNILHAMSKEARSVFSGAQSTMKHLVPSFKYNPARLGYLAECNRQAFCDELLRCIVNTRTTLEGSQREESVATMNDLLEHQKRQAGSGNSQVNVNMTARMIAASNPVRDIRDMEDLLMAIDASFLSRLLIYFQSPDHVDLIRHSRDSDLRVFTGKMQVNDWVSILDYLHTFHAKYDMGKVEEVWGDVPPVLSENLRKHYDARHRHHIECLMDGIVKTRCMLEGDMEFAAKPEDYDVLKMVWSAVIRSWIKPEHIRALPVKDRIFYLPEDCQFIYWRINELLRPVSSLEAEGMALKAMTPERFTTAMMILKETEVLIEEEGYYRPHYMKEDYVKGSQQRLSGRKPDEEMVQG